MSNLRNFFAFGANPLTLLTQTGNYPQVVQWLQGVYWTVRVSNERGDSWIPFSLLKSQAGDLFEFMLPTGELVCGREATLMPHMTKCSIQLEPEQGLCGQVHGDLRAALLQANVVGAMPPEDLLWTIPGRSPGVFEKAWKMDTVAGSCEVPLQAWPGFSKEWLAEVPCEIEITVVSYAASPTMPLQLKCEGRRGSVVYATGLACMGEGAAVFGTLDAAYWEDTARLYALSGERPWLTRATTEEELKLNVQLVRENSELAAYADWQTLSAADRRLVIELVQNKDVAVLHC